MAGIEKRRDYRPRAQREKEAYRLVLLGSGAGIVGVVTLVLAFAGVVSAVPPIALLLVAVWCALRFRRITSQR